MPVKIINMELRHPPYFYNKRLKRRPERDEQYWHCHSAFNEGQPFIITVTKSWHDYNGDGVNFVYNGKECWTYVDGLIPSITQGFNHANAA